MKDVLLAGDPEPTRSQQPQIIYQAT